MINAARVAIVGRAVAPPLFETMVVLGMAGGFLAPALDTLLGPRGPVWLQLALATPVVVWGGWPFFERGWASVVNRSPNMFTLIAMGTGVAYLYSLVAALLPGIFPASFRCPPVS